MFSPWKPGVFEEHLHTLTRSVCKHPLTEHSAVDALRSAVDFHIRFLEFHLSHALFPSANAIDNPRAAFASSPSSRYLPFLIASASSANLPTESQSNAPLLHWSPLRHSRGKPVYNQSALHGFHVFEGLQIVGERTIAGFRLGYTFLQEKVNKLVDGIIRLRFAVHFLKAHVLVARLVAAEDHDAPCRRAMLARLLTDLRLRRTQAERAVTHALFSFISANRNDIEAALAAESTAGFYVRVEAQGGNRESIGQGPLGVAQSTLQIFGQHVRRADVCTQMVLNLGGPPRTHTLAGPYTGTPYHELLSNACVHHGNMGHQHLSSELAQPLGAHMLMTTAELDQEGRLLGPFIAETNFSNVGFVFDGGRVVFPKSMSATYGLTQHVLRSALHEALEAGKELEGVASVDHVPLPLDELLQSVRDAKLVSAFVLGSMPGVERVDKLFVDRTLVGGSITEHKLDAESSALNTMKRLYACEYQKHIVWEHSTQHAPRDAEAK